MKQQPSRVTAKKPYEPPKLLIYGNLTEMTKAAGNGGRIDGGVRPSNKRRTGG